MLSSMAPTVVILVVAAFLMSLVTQTTASSCVPTSTKPDISSMEIKNVASERGPVLANLAGYVEFLGNDSGQYLPLDIDSVSILKPTDDHHTIILESECFVFSIDYKPRIADTNPGYVFNRLKMVIKNNLDAACNFDGNGQFYFFLPQDLRYSCKQIQSHQCSWAGQPIVNLVLNSFEIELDGATKNVIKGEFRKPAWDYSCNYWN